MKLKTTIICCLFFNTLIAQNYTISGYVKEVTTGENLIAATVFDNINNQGTVTNEYGFFSLTLPKGKVNLSVSYVGFETLKKELLLNKNIELNLNLAIAELSEVVVSASETDNIAQQTQMSSINLPIKQIKKLPQFGGEVDILKALSLMPGVNIGNEGSTGLFVRGGTPDQNLILLDGATVYNASHLFGFLSVFNVDAINNVNLIKGGFPARYGGRLSSVLDISMKEGNLKESSGSFSVGLLSSKVLWESPLGKRASYLVSARASYLTLLALPTKLDFIQKNTGEYINYNLFDINAKINYRFDDGGQAYLSVYTGNDYFVTEDNYNNSKEALNLNWGNVTTSFRYQKALTPKLFTQTTLNYTRYQHRLRASSEEEFPSLDLIEKSEVASTSNIQDIAAKVRFDYLPTANHRLKFGGEVIQHRFAPSIQQVNTVNNENKTFNAEIVWNTEAAAFVEDEMKLTENWTVNVGLRYSALRTESRWYGGLEPRLATSYHLNNSLSIKASYSLMRQYIHLLSNNGVGIPNDIWVPVTDRIPPQESNQYAIGLAKFFKKQNIEMSLEAYYKTSNDLIDFQQGVNFLFDFDNNWQDIVETSGIGESYGLEFFLHKKAGRFNGWFGYTLAWNNRQFDNINNGNWYPAKFDRRHDFEIVGNYKINSSWDVSATWIFNTGNAITLPAARYETDLGENVLIYKGRNQDRMPNYHRLDIGFNYHPTNRATWNFSLYNAYSRRNPYYLSVETRSVFGNGDNNPPTSSKSALIQKSLFPILPSVSYTLKFK